MLRRIVFLLVALAATNLHSQTTTRRIVAWPTTTNGAVISDTTSALLIDGTSLGTRSISLTNLGTAVLSTQAATAVTFSRLIISSTGSPAIGTIPFQVNTTLTTGVYSGTIAGIGFGRATTGVHFISPVTSTAYTTGTNAPYGLSFEPGGFGMYARVPSSRGFDWYVDATNVAGFSSSGFYASAFTTNLRGSGLQISTSNAAASGTITATNVIETLSGGITRTLSITGQTGRIYWCRNIGATTCTLHGGGANINGSATQAILSGSNALLFSNGANAFGFIQ